MSTPDEVVTPEWRSSIRSALERRVRLLERLNRSSRARRIALEVWRRDVAQWVSDMCWGYDPRLLRHDLPATVPFVPWSRQVEFLAFMTEQWRLGKPWVCEKTRDSGASFLACLWQLHAWLYREGWSGGLGSRTIDLVDTLDDPDSLFEKMRLNLRMFPRWALPKGFDERFHSLVGRLVNPENGASLIGQGGDDMGRGGRKSMFVVDEFAAIPRGEKAGAAVSFNADCWGAISTVRGMSNEFARMRHSGQYAVFVFDWRDDPRKTAEWYATKSAEWAHRPLVMAQEIDRDYAAGETGTLIPGAWVQATVGYRLTGSGRRVAGLDVATTGTAQSVYIVRHGAKIERVVAWSGTNTTATTLRALELAEEDSIDVVYYDEIGVGAGVTAAVESLARRTRVRFVGVNVGLPATDSDRFANLKAELWWAVRTRCEKTFDSASKSTDVSPTPVDELLAIPAHGAELLIAQLSVPRVQYTENGKVRVEPKDSLQRRGIPSPDHAEALVLTFATTSTDWGWI